jgi:pyruvate kinase
MVALRRRPGWLYSPLMARRAKIVATLGPVSASTEVLRQLLQAGVDVVRLNLSHGSSEDHHRLMQLVRQVAAEEDRLVPLIADLMGPRYRLGSLPDGGRTLSDGEQVTLGAPGTGADVPIDDIRLLTHLQPGERVLIDNGLVEMEIEEKRGEKLGARVASGGLIATRKGINLPDTDLPFTISDKDREDIRLAVSEGVDYFAASYVGSAADVEAVRQEVHRAGGDQQLVAKLERALAVEHLDEIVAAADASMVARGDLGVEVALDTVPVVQKRIVDAGRRLSKPIIVATQMLESMMEHPRPSRAESSDIANAVFEGADALMLSGETAAGQHPVEAVETMARIIEQAEGYEAGRHQTVKNVAGRVDRAALELFRAALDVASRDTDRMPTEIPDAVAEAAVITARRLGVCCIVAFSQTGFTARLVARFRPSNPIAVCTNNSATARRVQLIWGTRPLLVSEEVVQQGQLVQVVERHLLAKDLVEPGDRIVILMGDPLQDRPHTNLMRVHEVVGYEDRLRISAR